MGQTDAARPQPLDNPKFGRLIDTVEDYMHYCHNEDYCEDNDYRQYVFEEALAAVYGPDIFTYLNRITP